MRKNKDYTVVLLRPEDISDDPYDVAGGSTFTDWVTAASPTKAVKAARDNATKTDMRDEDLDPVDYALVMVCEGHIKALNHKVKHGS